ncbi:SSU ribosomal protein S1p [hydrothermal vent metagenome]|uniref:SSU ribosomal protein S1p n=1 Tax=hydrothermal vent metagenome TaxID=652676 RepID=A0A1W1E225_9ZZZZ
MEEDDFMSYASTHKKGSIVEVTVAEVTSSGAVVELADEITGYLKAGEISEERVDDVSTVLKVGDKIEVAIVNIDRKTRNISVSIKAKNSAEEKAAMANYNKQSSDAVEGATLGDLLKKAKQ